MWYLIRVYDDKGKVLSTRAEKASGPRKACKLAFGVIYDRPSDYAQYKRVVGGKSSIGKASRSDDGWQKIPVDGE